MGYTKMTKVKLGFVLSDLLSKGTGVSIVNVLLGQAGDIDVRLDNFLVPHLIS